MEWRKSHDDDDGGGSGGDCKWLSWQDSAGVDVITVYFEAVFFQIIFHKNSIKISTAAYQNSDQNCIAQKASFI